MSIAFLQLYVQHRVLSETKRHKHKHFKLIMLFMFISMFDIEDRLKKFQMLKIYLINCYSSNADQRIFEV